MRFLTAIAALALLAGCDASDPATEAIAPAVLTPDAFSFEPDAPDAKKGTGEHFFNAAFRVGVVSAIVQANLILPAAATHAATQTEPVVTDGVWVWASTFPINNDEVTFRLEGTPQGREIRWRLGITNRDLDDFTLYTARSDMNGETGDWQLFYEENGASVEVLRADFEVTGEDSRELTFSVPPGRDGAGSSVGYVHDGSTREFDWREEPAGLDHYIEWDAATGRGWIEADNYRDGERACWDETLANADCPGA